jgi:Ni/Co efflux regulator RcnB
MKRTLLTLATSLLLAGAAAPVLAQDVVYSERILVEPVYTSDDVDGDGIPNTLDPFDDRYDDDGNLVRFDVGEYLPDDAFGPATEVHHTLFGLRVPPAGARWNRLGNNLYLVSADGYVMDAVYNLRD